MPVPELEPAACTGICQYGKTTDIAQRRLHGTFTGTGGEPPWHKDSAGECLVIQSTPS